MTVYAVVLELSAFLVCALLSALPWVAGYLLIRPFDRHAVWLQDRMREAANPTERDVWRRALADHAARSGRRIAVAVVSFVALNAWAWFVVYNWQAIGRIIRLYLPS